MKTAILISGHMRSFDRCLSTLHWHVFRHFPEADFYLSTVADADAGKAALLRKQYPGAQIVEHVTPKQPVIPMPAGCPDEASWINPASGRSVPFMHEPYPISVSPQAVLRQLWQLRACWELVADPSHYDLVIRCRPDLWFHSFDWRSIIGGVESHLALTPWWGRFGGVNDRFAVLGREAAAAYFTTFDRITWLIAAGCPLHPESLVKASMEAAGATVETSLRAEFSKPNPDGTIARHFLQEVLTVDLADRAG